MTPAFFERLCSFLLAPWEPAFYFMGIHDCDICTLEVAPALQFGDKTIFMGIDNLFVPGEGCIYVAPSLIGHYIRAHQYGPPEEFIQAVLRCPAMNTPEYRQRMVANGGEELVRDSP